jgi:hypothetical protein
MNFKKYLGLILIAIFVCLGLYFLNFKEGFTATSCTQFTNCVECVNGKVKDTSSPCYWNNEKNKCGSFNDPGYSRLCYPTPPTPPEPTPPEPTPPEPTPTPGPCPICKQCPELTLLKNPTFITKQ